MLTIAIVGTVVLPVLLLVFYVVQRSRPRRFKINATLLKFISINIEIDAQDEVGEPAGGLPCWPWPCCLRASTGVCRSHEPLLLSWSLSRVEVLARKSRSALGLLYSAVVRASAREPL